MFEGGRLGEEQMEGEQTLVETQIQRHHMTMETDWSDTPMHKLEP